MIRRGSAGAALGLAALTGVSLVLYLLALQSPVLAPSRGLQGDLPAYVTRFGAAALLLGLVPLLAAWVAGFPPATLGIRAPRGGLHPALVPGAAIAAAVVGVVSSRFPDLAAFYPFSKTLLGRFQAGDPGALPLHALGYLLAYYLPWELCFRGVLVFPVVRALGLLQSGRETKGAGSVGGPVSMEALLVASLAAIPSALIHVGHPLGEGLGAIPFGVALAWLALRTGSILPGVLIHATLGISLDAVLFLAPR